MKYLPYGKPSVALQHPSNVTDAYFPVARKDGAVLVVAHDGHVDAQGNRFDQIYGAKTRTATFLSLAFNSCDADNSDPAPVGTDYILFSNDSVTGSYRPYIAAVTGDKVWPLQFASGVTNVLGISYFPSEL